MSENPMKNMSYEERRIYIRKAIEKIQNMSIPENEFDLSLNMDYHLLEYMTEKEQKKYCSVLAKTREAASPDNFLEPSENLKKWLSIKKILRIPLIPVTGNPADVKRLGYFFKDIFFFSDSIHISDTLYKTYVPSCRRHPPQFSPKHKSRANTKKYHLKAGHL